MNEVAPALTMTWVVVVTEDITGGRAGPVGPPLDWKPARMQALLGSLLR